VAEDEGQREDHS